jgi:hypothetical protein
MPYILIMNSATFSVGDSVAFGSDFGTVVEVSASGKTIKVEGADSTGPWVATFRSRKGGEFKGLEGNTVLRSV